MLKAFFAPLKDDRRLLYLIMFSAFVRILFALNPLMNGEAYYARGVYDLQWSYFDQPPLFFWISGFFVKVFGFENLPLRFSSILFFALTTLILYKTSLLIYKNKNAAFFAALVLNISAVFSLSFAIFAQPDSIFIFFWLLSFYSVYKLFFPSVSIENLRSSKYVLKWWLIFGISFGLGALSKYNIAFLGFGIIMYCLFNKDQRHWLWHYGPYLSLLVTLLIFLPVIYWNAQNEWISFVFQGTRAGATEESLRWDWFFRSIGGQTLWILPWIWVPLIWQVVVVLKDRSLFKSYSLLAWVTLPTIIFFTVVTLWSDLIYHFHWQTPGYLMLFIPLGYWLDGRVLSYGKVIKRWIYGTVLITLTLFVILIAHINTGFWTSYGPKWLALSFKQNNDPTIYAYKFDALKEKFEERGWMKDSTVFVGSNVWWLAGLIDYAFKGEKEFMLITNEPRNYAFLLDPKKMLNKNCVVISHDNFVIGGSDQISPFFESVQLVDSTYIERYEEENELKLYFFYCKTFKKPPIAMKEMPLYAQLHGLAPFSLIMNSPKKDEDVWQNIDNIYRTSFEFKNEHYRPKYITSQERNSGIFSCKLDTVYDFSYSLKVPTKPLKTIKVSFSAKALDSANIHLVSSKGKWWNGVDLKDKIKAGNEWQKVNFEINLPPEQNGNDTLALYFWNSKKQKSPVYLDDVEFQLIEQ